MHIKYPLSSLSNQLDYHSKNMHNNILTAVISCKSDQLLVFRHFSVWSAFKNESSEATSSNCNSTVKYTVRSVLHRQSRDANQKIKRLVYCQYG